MTTEPKHTPQEWLKEQCNRYVHGQCTTRGCLVRGGYEPGSARVDYSVATCEAHETLILLADNERLREALLKAYHELNVIRARDGVPYCFDGMKSDVDEAYFSSVVDEARAALAELEKK